jgi:hypothetical protein
MRYLSLLLFLLMCQSCFILRRPSLNITDQYIAISNPGQSWSLAAVEAIETDSIFGYPSKEKFLYSYTIVKRKGHKPLSPTARVRLYFNKRSPAYQWKRYNDFYLRDISYQDTLTIQPRTWYCLSADNNTYEIYFYQQERGGAWIVKEKPRPGAW